MKFSIFLERVEDLKTSEIGGLEAQFRMAPKLRLQYNAEKIAANNPRKAAVLVLFYPDDDGETYFLLTERASYNGTHSAQISFPGGKLDKTDKNLSETALREAFEEVGVASNSVTIFKEMTDVYIPPSNFLATPFLAYVTKRPNFITNHEVARILEISLEDLLDEGKLINIKMDTSYMKNTDVPAFKIEEHIIWGATGMMLSEIKQLIERVYF